MPMCSEPVVITGIGLITSLGNDRESVWEAVCRGESRFDFLSGIPGIPDGAVLGATVDLEEPLRGRLKAVPLCERSAAEALADARIELDQVDRDRFGCMLSGHMGDPGWVRNRLFEADPPDDVPWWEQLLPDTACSTIARKYDLAGPRLCHSTACASSLVSILSAARTIRDGQCDIAFAGGGDAIDPILTAGFARMRVLAKDAHPQRACRPFDSGRKGFVLGEGAAVLVLERLDHALERNARIYAEISATMACAQAHHVTGLDAESDSLAQLISRTLSRANLDPSHIGYINAHGTATQQNDVAEARGIRMAFGQAADSVTVSATKSILGHMIHAAGAVELAITALAMRDGFTPPTLNLDDPDPRCQLDCTPKVGRINRCQHALKLSIAFGGHLVAAVLSRWNDVRTGFAYPTRAAA